MALVLGSLVVGGWALWTALRRAPGGPTRAARPGAGRARRGDRAGPVGARARRGRRASPGSCCGGPTPGWTGCPSSWRSGCWRRSRPHDPAWEARFTEAMAGARFRCSYLNAEEGAVAPDRGTGGWRVMSQVVATAESNRPRPRRAGAHRARRLRGHPAGLLPEQFSDYRVESGGQGAGTRVPGGSRRRRSGSATSCSRSPSPAGHPGGVRHQLVDGHHLDRAPADAGASTVRVRTTWNGAGGIGGFFERTFAPKGLRRVYDEMLARLEPRARRPAEPHRRARVESQGPWPGDRRARRRAVAGLRSAELADLVADGDVLVLSGAGLSTDSGIPDYRGASGSPAPAHPDDLADLHAATRAAGTATGRAASSAGGRCAAPGRTPGTAPSPTCRRRACSAASSPRTSTGCTRPPARRDVVELHGGLDRTVCLHCGDVAGRAELDERLRAANPHFGPRADEVNPDGDAELPDEVLDGFVMVDCLACGGGPLKPDVVFFGETVPRDRVDALLPAARGVRQPARPRLVPDRHERLPVRAAGGRARHPGRRRQPRAHPRRREGRRQGRRPAGRGAARARDPAGVSREVGRTDDGRWIVVDGRRWRAADPALPDDVRTRLLHHLGVARSAVRGAGRADDEDALRRGPGPRPAGQDRPRRARPGLVGPGRRRPPRTLGVGAAGARRRG